MSGLDPLKIDTRCSSDSDINLEHLPDNEWMKKHVPLYRELSQEEFERRVMVLTNKVREFSPTTAKQALMADDWFAFWRDALPGGGTKAKFSNEEVAEWKRFSVLLSCHIMLFRFLHHLAQFPHHLAGHFHSTSSCYVKIVTVLSLFQTDLNVASEYASLVSDPTIRDDIFEAIKTRLPPVTTAVVISPRAHKRSPAEKSVMRTS